MDSDEILMVLLKFKDHPSLNDPTNELYDLHLAALDAEIYFRSEGISIS